ncbi:hypothetical protein NMY22_g13306 [Coprinellus aureogranulatus]|nr:hypothetical protein NMY22_g13306 [Coprinellus aureogranulatus]
MASKAPGKAAKITEAGIKALGQLVAQAEIHLPGFAVAVTNIEEELYTAAGGHRVYGDPSGGRVTPDHRFWICSLTKLITSIAALQLIEQGRLSVNDPVFQYIPQFKQVVVLEGEHSSKGPCPHRPAKEAITVAHLLNHTSGLAYFMTDPEAPYSVFDRMNMEHGPSRAATTERFLELLQEGYPGMPVVSEPGTACVYGSGIDILGIIVEKVTGECLNEYCKKYIFEPAGMESTTFMLAEESNKTTIELSRRNVDGTLVPWANHTRLIARFPEKVNFALGGGGAYSTLRDYASLLRHILALEAGKEVGRPILKFSTAKSLFQNTLSEMDFAPMDSTINFLDFSMAPKGWNWSNAFALTTEDWPGRRKAGTGFWFGWAGLAFLIDPATGVAIVVGSQVAPSMDSHAITLFNRVEETVYANLA